MNIWTDLTKRPLGPGDCDCPACLQSFLCGFRNEAYIASVIIYPECNLTVFASPKVQRKECSESSSHWRGKSLLFKGQSSTTLIVGQTFKTFQIWTFCQTCEIGESLSCMILWMLCLYFPVTTIMNTVAVLSTPSVAIPLFKIPRSSIAQQPPPPLGNYWLVIWSLDKFLCSLQHWKTDPFSETIALTFALWRVFFQKQGYTNFPCGGKVWNWLTVFLKPVSQPPPQTSWQWRSAGHPLMCFLN